jgi:exodeoxyribonuclease V gamma subunit
VLHLHRAERADRLADSLGEILRTPLPDPFAREVVAVPAKGVERWLTQRLSHVLGATDRDDGICSGIDFPSTGRLLAAAAHREDDPWDADRLVWPLLEVIDATLDQPWNTLLADYLGAGGAAEGVGDHRRGRRWSTAAHLGSLFAGYGADRPQMLRAWANGGDDRTDHGGRADGIHSRDTDGAGPLPDDVAWQARLWRELRTALGPSPAERLPEVCRGLRADPAATDLPARISLFGPTRLTTEQREILAALAEHREVHLWLPHPSPALWDRIAAAGRTELGAGRRRNDPTRDEPRHPLLASLGRDSRELQVALAGVPATVADRHETGPDLPPSTVGCRPISATTGRPTAATSSIRAIAAFSSTPATARPGRSRCSARCCCGCSPTTRPCSRATSSSCARTSRPTRR